LSVKIAFWVALSPGQDGVQERNVRAVAECVALIEGLVPEGFEDGAELLAHLGGDVGIDPVHARHGVAAAVHLDDLAEAGVLTGRERITGHAECLGWSVGVVGYSSVLAGMVAG
jgi:hypothetical protein